MSINDLFTDAARQLLGDQCTPAVVRAIEQGGSTSSLWAQLEQAGFPDALVTEADGGSGLGLDAIFGVFELCGEFSVPVPLAETMLIRGLLSHAGLDRPSGTTVFARGELLQNGTLQAGLVRMGRVADHVLVNLDGQWLLLPCASAQRTDSAFCLDASLVWMADAVAAAPRFNLDLPADASLRVLQACVVSALTSGALQAVFRRTLQYANERTQFGRPIGKFQAIQHQLAVMSEHVFAARMAAQVACSTAGVVPNALRVAVAKARTSEAALAVAELSHSIHGAIGFTAEYDLQLLTRRLHGWRQTAGSETYWHDQLGQVLVSQRSGLALDLIRETTDPLQEV